MERHLEHLFIDSKEFLDSLQGRELDTHLTGSPTLLSPASAQPCLNNLHIELSKAYPEAGMPYWRIRSWELSCWQPIYLALICVYHIKHVPSTLHQIHQDQKQDYISGYALSDGDWFTGEHEALVQYAAQQIKTLFDALQTTHLNLFGGRKVLYQAILADLFMGAMVNAGQAFATKEAIESEYLLWAKPLKLPTNCSKNIIQDTDKLTFNRRTCCLHFRRDDGNLCNNCPRLQKEKIKQRIPCLN